MQHSIRECVCTWGCWVWVCVCVGHFFLLTFVFKAPMRSNFVLIQVLPWYRTYITPIPEPMMDQFANRHIHLQGFILLTQINLPAWISTHKHSKMCDEIIYQFLISTVQNWNNMQHKKWNLIKHIVSYSLYHCPGISEACLFYVISDVPSKKSEFVACPPWICNETLRQKH